MLTTISSLFPQILDLATTLIILVISSLILLISFVIAKQSWIKSRQLAATILLLPIITYGITSVISGNISLSLGLVGALSIVRFRNPVKSPLELTAMFAAVSFGIMATQSPLWPIFISSALATTILIVHYSDFWAIRIFKKNLLSYSFAEAGNQYSLELSGFSEAHLDQLKSFDKNIAINATICLEEADNHCFISSDSKSTIESLYKLSSGNAEKRSINIGI
ncbi:DUF4956 domain-containing protein [Pseudomonadota bacterium]|nr:DUF4956 domain-containing protein [Pseudomonadota bacterium]